MALAQFDYARKRASQDAEAANQQQNDALKRRFAAQGGLNSGAFVKQQQVAADQGAVRKENAMQGIDAAEAQEVQRQNEVKEGRAFQTSERLGSQDYSSGESALQRRFMTGEREGSQNFQAGESKLARDLQDAQWSANYRMQKEGMALQDAQWSAGHNLQRDQMALQDAQWSASHNLEKQGFDFNKYIAEQELKQGQQGIVGGLLGQGGVTGTLGEVAGAGAGGIGGMASSLWSSFTGLFKF